MAGDGQQPQILKYAINPTTAAITYDMQINWSGLSAESCDTMNIVGDHIFMSCTYTTHGASSTVLPYVVKLLIADMTYVKTYNMRFNDAYTSPIRAYSERQIFPHATVISDTLYIYGISKVMYGSASTTRYPLIMTLDTVNEVYGGHLAESKMSEDQDDSIFF